MTASPSPRGRREGRTRSGPSSVAELATAELRRRIVTGEIAEGEHLSEAALAAKVGVSRASLREALRVLEADGLTVHVPRAGWRVVALDAEDAREILALREQLEEFAVREGVPAREERLAALDVALHGMRDAADADDERASLLASIDFARAFVALGDNARVDAAFRTILYPIGLLMRRNRLALAASETLEGKYLRHKALADRVRDGDAEGARDLMRSHPTSAFLRDSDPS